MSQCLTKQNYCNLEVAKRVALNYTETNYQGRVFRPYKCVICSGFHLTSKKFRKKR